MQKTTVDFHKRKKEENWNFVHWFIYNFTLLTLSFYFFSIASSGKAGEDFYRLEEVFGENALEGHQFNGSWISNTEFVFLSPDKNILLYNAVDNGRKRLTNKLNTVSNAHRK